MPKIFIEDKNIILEGTEGERLIDLFRRCGIDITSPCGGVGTCKKCGVFIQEGALIQEDVLMKEGDGEVLPAETGQVISMDVPLQPDLKEPSGFELKLACIYRIKGDIKVKIPASVSLETQTVLGSDNVSSSFNNGSVVYSINNSNGNGNINGNINGNGNCNGIISGGSIKYLVNNGNGKIYENVNINNNNAGCSINGGNVNISGNANISGSSAEYSVNKDNSYIINNGNVNNGNINNGGADIYVNSDGSVAGVGGIGGFFRQNPVVGRISVKMDAPELHNNISDLEKLVMELKKELKCEHISVSPILIKKLPDILRQASFEINAFVSFAEAVPALIDIAPAYAAIDNNSLLQPNTKNDKNQKLQDNEFEYDAGLNQEFTRQDKYYGFAVDIGTTTVAAELYELGSGTRVGVSGSGNRQAMYGSDVISRIVFEEENDNGLEILKESVVVTINALISNLLKKYNINKNTVKCLVVSGNTVMSHMFFGVTSGYLRREPYTPAALNFPVLTAAFQGIDILETAVVIMMPNVASYVGSDIVAGVLATGMNEEPGISMLVDIGTNGEIVIGGHGWLMTCACSAGPAFEGSGISCGTRAVPGAIDSAIIKACPGKECFDVKYSSIEGAKPTGICGSGIVSLISELTGAGIIDRAGNVYSDLILSNPDNRFFESNGEECFIVAFSEETADGGIIYISENDVKNLLRTKGAIFAGIRTLLSHMSVDVSEIDRIYIAGGFGSFINIDDAIKIGLLPDIDRNKYITSGNTSLKGAAMALLDVDMHMKSKELAANMTYFDLSSITSYMDEFVSAVFIPHTDKSLFPSVM